jgi:hydroxymethylglutaryl-CoA lyase
MAEPMSYPASVRIREVGPRDGVQSERASIPTPDKIRLIGSLAEAGVRYIEAVSFVSPKAIPQMADSVEVWKGLRRGPGVFYSALVPNRRGAETAAELGVDGMQVFIAASESYSMKNVNRSVRDSIENVRDVVEVARASRIPVEGTISTAFGDPYEGDVAPERVAEVSRWMTDEGVTTISYGDTTGMGTPRRVRELVETIRSALPSVEINMHFHDTRGTGLANVLTALELGVDYFDASIGGMGGSPYAEGATGNVATEDLVHMLEDMGIDTGIDLEALIRSAQLAQELVSGELPSKMLKAGPRTRLSKAG